MDTSKTKPEEPVQVPPGHVTWVISENELNMLVQLLSFTFGSCTSVAQEATKQGDAQTAEVFTARADLSAYMVNKINMLTKIGEPTSLQRH